MMRAHTLSRTGLATFAAAVLAVLAVAPAEAHVVRAVTSFATTGLEDPYGIAVDQATGALYVTGRASGNVEKYGASGVREASFSSPTLSFPAGVAVDDSGDASKGDVYVSDFVGETVLKLGPTGQAVAGFTPLSSGSFPAGVPGSEEFKPFGISVDPADGDLVVADRGSGEVDLFTSSGAFVTQFAVAGVFGVAIGKAGEILTSSGSGVQSWSSADGYSTPVAIGPELETHAVAADLATGVLFADGEGDIAEYAGSGLLLSQFGAGLLETSFGVALEEDSDTVYATEVSGLVYVFGAPLTFADVSTATPATSITSTSANLSGTVNPQDTSVTACDFQYGLGTSYGRSTPCTPAPPLTGAAAITVTAELQGLQPNATYHYRLAASNANGPSYGEDQTFQTTAAPPSIDGQSVSALAPTAATLNARVNPNNQETTYHFQYGTSAAYGSEVPIPGADLGAAYGDVNVGQRLAGLQPGTTYHYRVVASNASSPAGGTDGPDLTFTTPPLAPPVVVTGQAGGVSQGAGTLDATIDTQGYETVYEFDLGTDTSYGTRIFGDAGMERGTQTFTAALQGLSPGTTYHYRIVATNSFGTSYGADRAFTTGSYPSATLSAAVGAPMVPALLLAPAKSAAASSARAASATPVARAARHKQSKRRHVSRGAGKGAHRRGLAGNVNTGGSKR